MTSRTFAYVNTHFGQLLDQFDHGTVTSVDLINTAGSATVAKMVTKANFDTANLLSGSASIVTVPQLPYSMTPQRVGYNGLFKLVKQLHADNAVVDSSVKAILDHNVSTFASYAYVNGPGGVTFTALTAGTAGNNITITIVDPGAPTVTLLVTQVGTDITIRLATNGSSVVTTTMLQIQTAVNLVGGILVNATATGTTSTLAAANPLHNLAGGSTSDLIFAARAGGTGGNSLSVAVVNPGALHTLSAVFATNTLTITLGHDGVNLISTLAQVAALVVAGSYPITAVATGTTANIEDAFTSTPLAGGASAPANRPVYIAYEVTRSLLPSKQAGLAPSVFQPIRVVLISKAHADQLGL